MSNAGIITNSLAGKALIGSPNFSIKLALNLEKVLALKLLDKKVVISLLTTAGFTPKYPTLDPVSLTYTAFESFKFFQFKNPPFLIDCLPSLNL